MEETNKSNNSTLDIYSMKLHEVILVTPKSVNGVATSYFSVMRVAGGWIYQIWDTEKQDYAREVFVPFNSEFMKFTN